jgi:hypothetical protein
MPKILWTIRENRTLTADQFQRFIEKARQAGKSPAAVLQTFILGYIGEQEHDDPDDTRRDLRQGG